MKPAAELAREIATKFITNYRNDFPEVIDKWPKDYPLPDFPGVFDRLALIDLLSERLTALIEQERAAAWCEAIDAAAKEARHTIMTQTGLFNDELGHCVGTEAAASACEFNIRALEPPPERAEKGTT
jgi:hypothetical protein